MFERFLLGPVLSYFTYVSLGLAQGVFLTSIYNVNAWIRSMLG
jgi:hypothetical protein